MVSAARLIIGGMNATSYVAPRLAGRAAFRMFTKPINRAGVRPDEQPMLDEAERERIDVDGTAIETYRWGREDRPVLFIHGFQARATGWAAVIAGTREGGMSAVTYDAPGHGGSGGDQATILDHFAVIKRLEQVHGPFRAVVGHSFGAVCAFYAVRNGLAVDRMVAISGTSSFGALTDTFCQQLSLRPVIGRDLRRRTEQFFLPTTGIWEEFSPTHRPADITVPLLVVHDEADREVKVSHGREIAEAYPTSATLHLTNGLGHRRILRDMAVIKTVVTFLHNDPHMAIPPSTLNT